MLEKIWDLLRTRGRTTSGTTVWFSLHKNVNKKLQRFTKYDIKLPTISSVPEVLTTFMLYWTGLLPFFPLNNTYVASDIARFQLERRRSDALFV